MTEKTETTKKKLVKGWIGHKSWLSSPLAIVDAVGKAHPTLFETREYAIAAGWKKPSRVEIIVRLL